MSKRSSTNKREIHRPSKRRQYRIALFIAIGLALFIFGDILHHEIIHHSGEVFLVPVIESLLDKVE